MLGCVFVRERLCVVSDHLSWALLENTELSKELNTCISMEQLDRTLSCLVLRMSGCVLVA